MKGWGRSAPLAWLFQAQKKGRKIKSEVTESHCLLCSDLKDLKQPELLASDCADTSSESSCETAEQPLNTTTPTSLVLLKKAPRNSSSTSTSEEDTSDFGIQERNLKSDPLSNKLMFGNEQCIAIKTLPHHLQPNAQYPCLKDRGTGQVALTSSLFVLPPVKPPIPANSQPSSLKRRETRDQADGEANSVAVCGATGAITVGDKVSVDRVREKAIVIPYCSSVVDTCQGSLTSKHRPSQQQYPLLSISVSTKAQPTLTALGESLPRAPSLLIRQNLRQDDLSRSPLRHNSGHRSLLAFKAKSMRRVNPELPMLLGTRVTIPVSAQRLL